MTNHLPQRPGGRSSDGGLAWKSGLLGASLGAVLLGWALLARTDARDKAGAGSASSAASAPVQPIVVRVPVLAYDRAGSAEVLLVDPGVMAAPSASAATIDLPPLPQKPVFQQPVTRMRRS